MKNKFSTVCESAGDGETAYSRCRNKHECDGCRNYWINHWTLRTAAEGVTSDMVRFATFTFNDGGLRQFESQGLQGHPLFRYHIRRLQNRGRRDGFKVRHASCYETGERTGRPHYHSILFLTKQSKRAKLPEWLLNVRYDEPMWKHGQSQYELPRTKAGMIQYTFGYIGKKGGEVLRPSPGMGKAFLVNFAAMLGRNRRHFGGKFGVEIFAPNLRMKQSGPMGYSGQGRMIKKILPYSHCYVPEMFRAYCAALIEVGGTPDYERYIGRIGGDWL